MKKQKHKRKAEPEKKVKSKATIREKDGFKIVTRDRGVLVNPYGPPTGRM
jgi:hypothetical protein